MAEDRDVIQILTHDHREVEGWFSEYEKATSPEQKLQLVDNCIIELVRHSEAEEQYLYPATRTAVQNGDAIADREIAEHSEAEKIMNKLDGKKPDDPEFDPLMRELMTAIKEHVEEEESGLFPQLRKTLSEDDLMELGRKVETAKKMAPTHPHPAAPDHPPFNKLLGPGPALVDRVRDFLSGRKQR